MIDNINTAGTGPVYPTAPATKTKPTAATPSKGTVDTSVPDTPPQEVLHALDTAQGVVNDLASKNLEMRFEVDDGTVRTQLIDSKGNIVQEIPARHGLDALAGRHVVDRFA
jgi:hypothetical protein